MHIPMLDPDRCKECNGTGMKSGPYGYIKNTDFDSVYEACPDCEGSGMTVRCGTCHKPLQLVRPGKWQCNSEECN